MLRGAVQLRDRLGDLRDTGALLLRRFGDARHGSGGVCRALDDLSHGGAGLGHQRGAGLHFSHRVGDQLLDVLGCRCRALRQVAHLTGHHGKAAALLAGTRRLDRGIQRQDVGLEGDRVDHADDVADLARRRVDRLHRAHDLPNRRAATLGHGRRVFCEAAGALGAFGRLLHGAAQLFH